MHLSIMIRAYKDTDNLSRPVCVLFAFRGNKPISGVLGGLFYPHIKNQGIPGGIRLQPKTTCLMPHSGVFAIYFFRLISSHFPITS